MPLVGWKCGPAFPIYNGNIEHGRSSNVLSGLNLSLCGLKLQFSMTFLPCYSKFTKSSKTLTFSPNTLRQILHISPALILQSSCALYYLSSSRELMFKNKPLSSFVVAEDGVYPLYPAPIGPMYTVYHPNTTCAEHFLL